MGRQTLVIAVNVMLVTASALSVAAVADAATIRQGSTAYTGATTGRAIGNTLFEATSTTGSGGAKTCGSSSAGGSPNTSLFGTGNITSSAVPGTNGQINTLSDGNPLVNPSSSTPSNPCPSTIPGLNPCTNHFSDLPKGISTVIRSTTNAAIQIGIINVNISCSTSTGNATATYTSGAGTAAAIQSDAKSYPTGSDFTFTDQPFFRSAGSTAFPARAFFTSTVRFSGTGGTLTITNP